MVRRVSRSAVVNTLDGGGVAVDAAVDERKRLDLRDMLPASIGSLYQLKSFVSDHCSPKAAIQQSVVRAACCGICYKWA